MKISAYSYTNKGGREHNEDSLKCAPDGARGVFVLADGLGGHESGEIASRIAVETIFAGCADMTAPSTEELTYLFHTANDRIIRQQGVAGQEEMKTTAVALTIIGEEAVWAHIGDSRLYYFSGAELARVTKDHSVTYMKYLGGEISYMDVYHDDDRSSLMRVLGKNPCNPEAGATRVQPGDAFLLCTDGLWEFVYNEEMLADWLRAANPFKWAQLMLLRHIRRIPAENDNFSLITVFVEE